MSELKTFDDWAPKQTEMVVGNNPLIVRELTIAQRDAVVKTIFDNVDLISLLSPLVSNITPDGKGGTDINLTEIILSLKDVLYGLITKDLTGLSSIILDNGENRKRLKIEDQLTKDEDTGIMYSPEMRSWIHENLTIRQEAKVLEGFVQVNDFIGLVKNYWGLVMSTIETAGLKDGATLVRKKVKSKKTQPAI
jgi:hypothetical protein